MAGGGTPREGRVVGAADEPLFLWSEVDLPPGGE